MLPPNWCCCATVSAAVAVTVTATGFSGSSQKHHFSTGAVAVAGGLLLSSGREWGAASDYH